MSVSLWFVFFDIGLKKAFLNKFRSIREKFNNVIRSILLLCNVKIFLRKKKKKKETFKKTFSLFKKGSTNYNRLNRINIFVKKIKSYPLHIVSTDDTMESAIRVAILLLMSGISMKLVSEISSAGNNARNSTWKTRWKKTTDGISSHEVVTIGRVRGIIWTGSRDNTIFRGRRFPAMISRVFIEFRDVRGGYHGISCAVTVDNAVKNKSSVRGVSYRGLENENEFTKPSTFHNVIPSPS